jgi:ribosomal protein S17E
MLQITKTRLIVQRDNVTKDKYYPRVVNATCSYAYPFSIPTATIEIITNVEDATDGYISPVRVDDIIRLQVSTQMSQNEKIVWEDIFEGRVRDISSTYSDKNTSTLFCVGHLGECAFASIDYNKEWSSTTDAKDIIAYLVPMSTTGWLTRIEYLSDFVDTGASIQYLNIVGCQRYVSDVFADLEKLSKYHYYFSIVTMYDNLGNLAHTYLRWRHFPTKITNKYAVIEGSERLISAEFKSSAEELWNYVRVFGETDTTAETQKNGAALSRTSIDKYTYRNKMLTVTGIHSNYLCANIAASIVQRFKNPIVSGQATIIGTASVRLGDLVHVKLPSLEINGAYVDRNYHVYKFTHTISEDKFTTTLDFTKVKKKPEDYIADFAKQSRQDNSNLIAGYITTTSANNIDGEADTGDTSEYGDSGYRDTSTWEDNIDYSPNY